MKLTGCLQNKRGLMDIFVFLPSTRIKIQGAAAAEQKLQYVWFMRLLIWKYLKLYLDSLDTWLIISRTRNTRLWPEDLGLKIWGWIAKN